MVQWTKRLAAVRWPWVQIPGPAPPKWGHPRWMNSPQEAPPKFVDEQSHGKAVELALRNPQTLVGGGSPSLTSPASQAKYNTVHPPPPCHVAERGPVHQCQCS